LTLLAEVNASRFEELPEPPREGLDVLATTRDSRREVVLTANHPPPGKGVKRSSGEDRLAAPP
jgi:hypothetical protein